MAIDLLSHVKTRYQWTPILIPNYRQNNSVSRSWNLGIKQAKKIGADYILVTNDDILLGPNCIDNLVKSIESHNAIMATALNMRGSIENPDDILNYNIDSDDYDLNPDFCCWLAKTDILKVIGKFDENFQRAYFEDNDFHYRIKLLGFEAIKVVNAPMYHYGSQTQNADPNNPVVPPPMFIENREYYIKKWGGIPGFETYTHPYNNLQLSPRKWLENV